jgi:hypothetical protein
MSFLTSPEFERRESYCNRTAIRFLHVASESCLASSRPPPELDYLFVAQEKVAGSSPSVTLLMKLFGRFPGGRAIEEETNEGHFSRRVHELADGQLEEIVSSLKNAREHMVGPVNRCDAAEGDRQGNQRPCRRDRLTPHASGRSQRLPQSYLGPIQEVCDVRYLAGYYAQPYEESTPAGPGQGR